MDNKRAADFVKKEWAEHAIPSRSLMEFVRIRNVSPAFDPTWASNGLQEQAFDLVKGWAEQQDLKNCKIELLQEVRRPHPAPLHGGRSLRIRAELHAVRAYR